MRSRFTYDTLGRQVEQIDFEANGITVAYSRTADFNNKSQLLSDYTVTKKSDGATYQASTTYDYGYGTSYALGSALSVSTVNSKNNNNAQAPDTLTTNSYDWWDGAVQAGISHKPDTAQATTYYTSFTYNGLGQLMAAYIGDARARAVTFRLNAEGQIIRRDEQDNNYSNGDPHEVWYRFNGRQLGYTGNNGTSDVSIAESPPVTIRPFYRSRASSTLPSLTGLPFPFSPIVHRRQPGSCLTQPPSPRSGRA